MNALDKILGLGVKIIPNPPKSTTRVYTFSLGLDQRKPVELHTHSTGYLRLMYYHPHLSSPQYIEFNPIKSVKIPSGYKAEKKLYDNEEELLERALLRFNKTFECS